MRLLEQRLARLEQSGTAGAGLYVWAEVGETLEQAIARQFPNGLAEGGRVTVFQWPT